MSSSSDWRCPNRGCRTLLGDQRDGALYPRPGVTVEKLTRGGVSTVRCPACGAARLWMPRGRSATGAAASR